jgi:hypothetical protein
MHLRTMISSSSVRVKNLSSIVQGCRSCCRDGAITYRRRLFPTSSSPSSLTTALFRLQYRTFQSTTGLLDQPSPIVWTTHRLSPEQILKVDKIFHKILWLDFMEAALLVRVRSVVLFWYFAWTELDLQNVVLQLPATSTTTFTD